MCLAFFLSLLFFMLMPSPGIFCFLGICILNIITYFMKKQDIDLYLNSFRCVIQLLEAQKGLEKLKIPELESYRGGEQEIPGMPENLSERFFSGPGPEQVREEDWKGCSWIISVCLPISI